jgi:DNA-binding PadR family transcriptional regulator
MLELAILGLLKDQDLHGYELKRQLANTPGLGTLGFGRGVSFGSLYPALRRLERAGAVEAVEPSTASGAPVPMTGSLGGELAIFRSHMAAGRAGRGKKVYRITPRGEALFDELLATETQSSDDVRVFNLRLAFARYLPPDARLGMLEHRRAQLVERLAHLGARLRGPREPADGYARSLMEHDQETAEHDLSWIERLSATERARGPIPDAAAPVAAHQRVDSQRTAQLSTNGAVSPSIAGLRPAVSQEDNTA